MQRTLLLLSVVALWVSATFAEIYFKEQFIDESWETRWVQSKHKDEYGSFKLSHGKFYNNETNDLGIQTSQDARFYSLSVKFEKAFSNKGKKLVLQFSVKHEQDIDCGGGYVKLMAWDADLEKFHGETPYYVMFGPDICGPGTKKVHVIINYKGNNHLTKKDIRCKDDVLTHLYTLIISPDNTYEVQIDGEKAEGGELEADWDLLAPKKIKDPDAHKPEDWDEREYIDDEEDKKPEDWDKPEHIVDADAKKPEDWDDEMDGEWEPPMIDNPEYKGEWKPKQKKNPEYKGKWVHPEIDNPEYVPDDELYVFKNIGSLGFDLWQVKSGSIFDNIIVTDSVEEAKEFAEQTLKETMEGEKKMKEKHDEEEAKKMEAESKAKEDEEEEDEDADEKEETKDKDKLKEKDEVKEDETATKEEEKHEEL